MIRIAIDTGGTFTDFASAGNLKGKPDQKIFVKSPTNYEDPAKGMIDGLKKLADRWSVGLSELLSECEQISHGTTLALNALLQKKGVKTALFTTNGFRDALEIRRSQLENQWNLRIEMPEVLVPRRLRLGIKERLDYKGDVVIPLDEECVRSACRICRESGVRAIAVCYLFSFLNPEHERRTAELIREELPDVFVCISSEVAPRIREYERTSTTVLNAYLTPVLSNYLNRIGDALSEYGWNRPIHMMLNSGGLSDAKAIANSAVKTLMSGPAGGAVGNATLAKLLGKRQMVLADMGGTSFDVHVLHEGKNELTPQSYLEGYPLNLPMIEIHSVGAGGGSIAKADKSGQVWIGPESAGAVPGPACYGKGGTNATVTDALYVLGLLDAAHFSNGDIRLSYGSAENALRNDLAEPLGVGITDAALIAYRIAAEKMTDAVRLVTMRKGNDPRQYSLLSAGGAFALFAAQIMNSLSMPEVLIPVQSPVFCAWGMMGAVRRSDLTRSFFMEQERWDADALSESIARLMRDGVRDLTELGVPEERRRFLLEFEMRYIGQHHEISVAFDDARQNADCKDALNEAFHRTHRKIFTYAEEDRQWEIVHLHLACSEEEGENMLFASDEEETTETRTVCGEVFGLNGLPEVPVYSEGAAFRKRISGPAMIRQTYTTVVIPCGCVCDAAGEGVLRIQRRTEA